jgi:hypothetical protein
MIRVTADRFPALFSTLTTLSYAMGAVNRHEPERAFFDVPERFADDLEHIDIALEHLTEAEIETFTDGEDTEIQEIAGRNPSLTRANELLNVMFDSDEASI